MVHSKKEGSEMDTKDQEFLLALTRRVDDITRSPINNLAESFEVIVTEDVFTISPRVQRLWYGIVVLGNLAVDLAVESFLDGDFARFWLGSSKASVAVSMLTETLVGFFRTLEFNVPELEHRLQSMAESLDELRFPLSKRKPQLVILGR